MKKTLSSKTKTFDLIFQKIFDAESSQIITIVFKFYNN